MQRTKMAKQSQPNQLDMLCTNLPILKREVILEYMRRNNIPFPTQYIPHTPEPKQLSFLSLTCQDAFYGGAAGGMKSDSLLMAALQYVEVPGYNAILIRDTYANLNKPEALMERAFDWLHNTDAKWDEQKKIWHFPLGATLGFGYLDGPKDHFNYQGPAYQFVGIDEVVNIRQNQALYMFSRLRRLVKYNNVPIRFRCTSNPPTREQLIKGKWVAERYVTPALEWLRSCKEKEMKEDGATKTQIEEMKQKPLTISDFSDEDVILFTPSSEQGNTKKVRAFIPARMDDNPHLDIKEYDDSLGELDYVTRRQLRDGDWTIKPQGRIVDRSWFEIVDEVPVNAARVRAWDWAATKPEGDNEPCWTVGVKISRTAEGYIFIEDIADTQDTPAKVETLVMRTAEMDGLTVPIRGETEPGSAGKSHISNYQRNVLPQYDFKGLPVSGDKGTRFRAFANQAEAGNVYLKRAAWNERYLDALEALPDSGWDYADSTSLGYNHLAGLGRSIGRVRVLESGGNGKKIKPIETDDLEDDMIPVYMHGRLLGYEPMMSDDDLARRKDLIPLYEQGRLVRCDTAISYLGEHKRGISG